jgi:hypothetical protein
MISSDPWIPTTNHLCTQRLARSIESITAQFLHREITFTCLCFRVERGEIFSSVLTELASARVITEMMSSITSVPQPLTLMLKCKCLTYVPNSGVYIGSKLLAFWVVFNVLTSLCVPVSLIISELTIACYQYSKNKIQLYLRCVVINLWGKSSV